MSTEVTRPPRAWSNLPEELQLRVLSFVRPPDLQRMQRVSRADNALAKDDLLWEAQMRVHPWASRMASRARLRLLKEPQAPLRGQAAFLHVMTLEKSQYKLAQKELLKCRGELIELFQGTVYGAHVGAVHIAAALPPLPVLETAKRQVQHAEDTCTSMRAALDGTGLVWNPGACTKLIRWAARLVVRSS